MTDTPGTTIPGDWRNRDFVRLWHEKDDDIGDRLAFPRSLTAAVVATGTTEPGVIVDIGSGPGLYLSVLLDAFPKARGVWVDASTPMLEIAQARLGEYGDRISYVIADMREIDRADLPEADVVVSSRAAHHLTYAELVAFYRASFALLRSGGWIANLDHTEPPAGWDARYKLLRKKDRPSKKRSADLPPHRHDHPRPTVTENLSALHEAGFAEPELVWKAYHTCLFMAPK
ncbi:class I SAM-dependent methyltransferase [Nocardioides agariphilus]|jgi:trans-aconitate methyltransferase|uniref:Class I SAM-dependent methyltransferase n=1 Tax=Nocardioides agariphilus TaxID=433664 RepID=A0A930VQ07_9ACTN|nr:class I SAM-dependent methyltransferase [Nocardioides agariphilus]MBF4768785.1 class I SAM-dependent methyltransferase [Nocardioides agariphilus]